MASGRRSCRKPTVARSTSKATTSPISSFLIAGVDRGSGLTSALMWGAPSQKLVVERAEVGLLNRADGKAVWSAKSEATGLSPPTLGKTAVTVQASKSLVLYDRASGKPTPAEHRLLTPTRSSPAVSTRRRR